MAIGGNRFGGSYGGGEDSLFRLKLRNELMSRLNSGGNRQTARMPAGQPMRSNSGGGNSVGPVGLSSPTGHVAMSGSMSPESTEDWALQYKTRALYGDRWNTKGGIGRKGLMREEMENRRRIEDRRGRAHEYAADKDLERGKYRADKEFGARQNSIEMEREWRAREHQSKFNTDTFGGGQLGTEVKNVRAIEIQAEAARQQAEAQKMRARQGLFKPEKYVGEGMVERFAMPTMEDGTPVMRALPIVGQEPGSIPNQQNPSVRGRPSNKPGERSLDWDAWDSYIKPR